MTDVAIAGGGASGVLLAAQILRESSDARVVVFDPGELGLGTAYSTTCPTHQLNVPASRMSAFADDPRHFNNWLDRRYTGDYNGGSFVPRYIYGEYLRSIALETSATFGERFEHRKEMLERRPQKVDIFVLATGNTMPAEWPGAPKTERFFSKAWQQGALAPETTNESVLILGTGLTAVDAVLGLRHNGHRGPIYLVSRRGLLPHEHRLFDAPPDTRTGSNTLEDLSFSSLRANAGGNWRAAIDGVRPLMNDLWLGLTYAERRRFLRHATPYWNVHRHRMTPEAAIAIAELLASGTVATIAGRTLSFEVLPNGMRVRLRERGSDNERELEVQRAINCSGPEHNFAKLRNPLIRSLIDDGVLIPNALNIGVDVASDGALIDMNGSPSRSVFAIGPVRFGTLIETTAIPEIREQAKLLGRTIANLLTAVV